MKLLLCLVMMIVSCFGGAGFDPVQADFSDSETIRLPIIMYHNVLKSKTGKYIVTPEQLEEDFIALNAAGYTTVFMSQVIDWMDGRGSLPLKPVVITFDDGHYNNIHYGLGLAKKHNIKFMINPVTSFSKFSVTSGDHSNPNYSHITWEQMKMAADSGHVEFGNHTHNMHKFRPRYGVMQLKGEIVEDYSDNLRRDILESQHLIEASGVPIPRTFAYPFGKYSRQSREILLDLGFRALLTCNEKVSKITRGEPESLHSLGRYNRSGNYSTEAFLKKIE